MPQWSNSTRRERLPDDWTKRRRRAMKAAGERCEHMMFTGGRCPELASDVDHIVPGDNHDQSNLQALCEYHHLKKSGAEGAAALEKKRDEIRKRFRRTETHPGLL